MNFFHFFLRRKSLTSLVALIRRLDWSLLTQIGIFFAKAGAFVFGCGLAIVPFLYGGVVTDEHHAPLT